MLFTRGTSYLSLKLLLYAVLSILLMIVDLRIPQVHVVRSVLSTAVLPIQTLVNWPVEIANWLSTNLATQRQLLSENADLHAQLILLQTKLQKLLALEQENNQLRALLRSSPRAGERVLVAQLLATYSESFVHQVVLNKGARDGVFLGQPVLDANGIFGQVIELAPFTSRVLTIIDTRFAIPIEDSRNGLRGIVVGTGNPERLSLINIPQTADIKPGDLLLTSGLGGRFPAGYPVGKVQSVNYNTGEEFANIAVSPSAAVNRSQLVLLVWIHNNTDAISQQVHLPTQKMAISR